MVAGFAGYDPAVRLAGVILNRVGSERHRALVADAIARLGVPVLGAMPRDETLALPERHLGLVQAQRAWRSGGAAGAAGGCGRAALRCRRDRGGGEDVDARAKPGHDEHAMCAAAARPAHRARVGRGVHFMYPHLLDGWRRAGAEIVPFSPLADEPPPEHCDVCWLPGGYPELHAGALAGAQTFRAGLARFAATRPVHGECGGYMVLGEGLVDADGMRHAMAGLLGHATSFAQRRLHLGYRAARLLAACPIGAAGARVRGHEFHHASLIAPRRRRAARRDRATRRGARSRRRAAGAAT